MRLFARNLLAIAVVGMLFGCGGVILAGDREKSEDVKIKHMGKVVVVTVDEDGERHEEVFELDEDGPRPFLGVHLEEGADSGAVVAKVIKDTGAERAGLREGDIIVAIDGEDLDGSWSLTKKILKKNPGDSVELEIIRGGNRETVIAELGEREGPSKLLIGEFDSEEFEKQMELLEERLEDLEIDLGGLDEHLEDLNIHIEKDLDIPELRHKIVTISTNRPILGVQLVEATGELREHLGGPEDAGVLVSKVLPGMPAEDAGVEVGDLIVAIDGEEVEDAGDLVSGLRGKYGETVELEIVRDGRSLILDAALPEREKGAD